METGWSFLLQALCTPEGGGLWSRRVGRAGSGRRGLLRLGGVVYLAPALIVACSLDAWLSRWPSGYSVAFSVWKSLYLMNTASMSCGLGT